MREGGGLEIAFGNAVKRIAELTDPWNAAGIGPAPLAMAEDREMFGRRLPGALDFTV